MVLNEIHFDAPDSKSRYTEFLELYNPQPQPVDVSGWALDRGVSYTFPTGAVIAAQGFLVIAEDPPNVRSFFNAGALGPWTGSLHNEGEEVRLVDAAGVEVDRVVYQIGFPWPTVGDLPGNSIQLLNAELDNDLGGSWRSAPPTPGRTNAVATLAIPPQIRQVQHHPRQPGSAQPVTITAKITDPDGVADVQLQYQVVAPGNYLRLTDAAYKTNWTSLPMNDEGAGGDEAAQDGIYTAQVPAAVQAHRRLVRYRIVAADTPGNSVRVPYADDPSPNFAYFVYDGVPAWTGAVQPSVTAPQTFDTNVMRSVPPWHLLSRNQDVLDCQYNSSYNDGIYHFEGALVVEGEVYDHVHYRVKGQWNPYVAGKNKWKFKFNRGHWLTLQDNYGRKQQTPLETLNVSALATPWAPWNKGQAGLDEAVLFKFSNLAGLPAANAAYFQLRVIDGAAEANPSNQYEGDLWGLYLGYEVLDNQFKEEHGLPDGNIFLMHGLANDTHLLGQGRGQPTNLADVRWFTSATTGYNRSPTQPETWWPTNLNLAGYATWRALIDVANNTDMRDQENCVYFRNPLTGRWSIHLWDVDHCYEPWDYYGPEGLEPQYVLDQLRRALQHPALNLEFQNRVRELQDLLLNGDQGWSVLDEHLAFITQAGPANPGFVEVDRRMWDWNPRTQVGGDLSAPPRGNYYRSPFTFTVFGQTLSRAYTSADFAGLVQWVKDFISPTGFGGRQIAGLAADATIPETPVLGYRGAEGYPANALVFETTAFRSPTNRAFAALQWRVGEVLNPRVPNYVAGTPWVYEIEPRWTSAELSQFASTVTLPPTSVQPGHTYRVRVRHKDSGGRWSHWSAPHPFTAGVPEAAAWRESLVITEIMYNPAGGADYEFIELMNIGAEAVDLRPVRFTQGVTFEFAAGSITNLAPGARVLVVKNAAAFAQHYGTNLPVAGQFAGKLDNAGEEITLTYGADTPLRHFAFGTGGAWPVAADGWGCSLVLVAPETDPDPALGVNWRASAQPGGAPGLADADPVIPRVLINEILSASDPPALDALELFNPTAAEVDLGGWFLTDDPSIPMKFRIPPGATIAPGGYRVFTEADFNAVPAATNSFQLRSGGDEIYLFSGDAQTNLTGYSHGVSFDASAAGDTLGRLLISTGEEQFPVQATPTLGAVNSGPRLGPVVITEIQYHPGPSGIEFVELKNISASTVPLFDPVHPTNTWKLSGLDYTFPTNLILAPGEVLLVSGSTPDDFRAQFQAPETVRVLGPFAGSLQDSGEWLRLQRPDVPDTNGVACVTVDEVRFNDRAPWPTLADGQGPSLQKRQAAEYGNDPAHWCAAAPTPGADFADGAGPTILAPPANITAIAGQQLELAVLASGSEPLQFQWLFHGDPLPGATNSTLVFTSVQPINAGTYQVVVFDRAGALSSAPALLTLLVPPTIAQQPLSVTTLAGSNVNFRVVASGQGPLAYQWRHDGAPLSGATNSVLTLAGVRSADSGLYTVLVRDGPAWVLSQAAELWLKPVLLEHPAPQTNWVAPGGSASFRAVADGTFPLTFRWRLGGAALANLTLETNVCYFTLTNVQPGPALNVTVGVFNRAGFAPLSRSAWIVIPGAAPVPPPVWTNAPPVCAPLVSLLTNQVPQNPNANDGAAYELGLKFQSDVSGAIVALRYWKAPSDTGTHTGHVWSATGAELAKAAFTGETAAGWQTALLTPPLLLASNTPCVVSVNINSYYAVTSDLLQSPLVNPPLRSLADGHNGVFGPPGQFPTQSFRNSGYFRDLLFTTDDDATDTDADGMPDRWETAFGLDPQDPFDSFDDPDGDGFGNREEWIAGTHPRDPASYPRIDSIQPLPPNRLVLAFQTQRQRAYQVLAATSLTNAQWSSLATVRADLTNARPVRITNSTAGPSRFYRLVTPSR